MLHGVAIITVSVDNFDSSSEALVELLGYRRESVGTVSAELARFWGAGATAGARQALFLPGSGEDVYLRLVEADLPADYAPLETYGWNAVELHVQDVHRLAMQLAGTDYDIIGGPRDLLGNGTAIALQVRGPSKEVFYLTEINSENMQTTYGKALARVGRAFIVVLGSSDHSRSMDYYGALAGRRTRPRTFPIRVLAAAHGMDIYKSRFRIGSAVLRDAFRIEIDGYPESARPRQITPGHLPPGMCIVSMTTDSLDVLPATGSVATIDEAPYAGRRCALIEGPDGEWIEIIEEPGA